MSIASGMPAFSKRCGWVSVAKLFAVIWPCILMGGTPSKILPTLNILAAHFFFVAAAFKAGRMGADPSGFWYQGELGFFDNYIIPLAKKLKDCNVFGVSSDECLNYAELNRAEWEERGQHIVEEMMRELQSSDQQEHSIVHFDELDDELDNELEEALMEASSRSALLNEVEV